MHIVIVNAHWNNRGDEAAHRALWEELQHIYPKCRITVMFKDRKTISWFPELENVNYFSCQFNAASWDIWLTALTLGVLGKDRLLKKAVQTLRTADLIIYPPGGSVINDRFFWSKQMEYLLPFICARFYRTPMFVAAPSIGPFTKRRNIRTWLLKTPKVFCVRESISKRYLEHIGIRKNIHVTMDLAFMNRVDIEDNKRKLADYPDMETFLQKHEKTIGMTISDFKWHVKHGENRDLKQRLESSFQQMIDYLTDREFGVLLIPQLFGNQNDVTLLKTFSKNEHVMVMSDEPDAHFQQYIISKLYAVVGMRYHCNIFAAKAGTPFIAVTYEEKMSGFLDMAGLQDYSIPLEEVSKERLLSRFHVMENNYEDLREKLKKDVMSWRDNARKTIKLLSENY